MGAVGGEEVALLVVVLCANFRLRCVSYIVCVVVCGAGARWAINERDPQGPEVTCCC